MPTPSETAKQNLTEFVSIDLTALGDTVYYFVNAGDPNGIGDAQEFNPVTWNGHTWQPLPFNTAAWQRGGKDQSKPKITIPDFNGSLEFVLKNHYGGTGARVTRYNVLDPTAGSPVYTEEDYILETYESTGLQISLQLATAFDFTKSQLPGYTMRRDTGYPGLGSGLKR